MNMDSHEVTKFMDEEDVVAVTTGTVIDPSSRIIQYDDSVLQDFFRRPIKIHSTTWTVGSGLDFKLDPWSLYFSNTNVLRKLSNYYFLQANLHVKIVINGTPFHYGHLVASYLPLANATRMHDPSTYVTPDERNMKMSMLMNVELDPVDNKSGILCLPFTYPYDAIIIPNLLQGFGTLGNLGDLFVKSFTDLDAASSAPATAISVSVFAWASDVVLTGPDRKSVV